MLAIHLRFPLGVYYALGAESDGTDGRSAEWPPNPVRLVGALLDAAHGQPGEASEESLDVISRLSAADPPTIVAPRATRTPERGEVAILDGVSRWAPRNAALSELKAGLSLRDLAGPRAAVDKGGVAIGDEPVVMLWPALDLTAGEQRTLTALAADVAWLGTSRSPVLVQVAAMLDGGVRGEHWEPLAVDDPRRPEAQVRVPTARTISAFDAEYERRRSAKGKLESSGVQKPASSGPTIGYTTRSSVEPWDPRHWGQWYVLELSSESRTSPKSTASYLVARAFRAALLAQFDDPGKPGEAPEVLRGRGGTPHAAVVPLSFVAGTHADGLVKGIALLMPHAARLQGEVGDFEVVEQALGRLLDSGGEVRVRDSSFVVREANVVRPLASLDFARYVGPSTAWSTVTPVVHSHWRSAKSRQALIDQVVADCAHVGLPAPRRVEVRRQPDFPGAPPAFLSARDVPADWRGPVNGPVQHLRLEFEEPVRGPILLGRARHFGIGLLRPRKQEQEHDR